MRRRAALGMLLFCELLGCGTARKFGDPDEPAAGGSMSSAAGDSSGDTAVGGTLAGGASGRGSADSDGSADSNSGAAGDSTMQMMSSAGIPGAAVCAEGDLQCSGTQPQQCDANGAWQNEGAPCAGLCSAGVCSGTCTPSATQCSGLQPQQCDSTGVWQNNGAACPLACSNGTCVGTCVPGSLHCNALQPQLCSSDASLSDTGTACANVCIDGKCTGTCSPNATQCNPTQPLQPQLCDATGAWQDSGPACASVCNGGSCQTCMVGAKQCNGTQPQLCDSAGKWQNNGTVCTNQACSVGACTGVCTPTSVDCSSAGLPEACSAMGAWVAGMACSAQACVGGACTGTCAPGALTCNGLQPQKCDATGKMQALSAACQFLCLPSTARCGNCTPGTKQCSGLEAQLCSATGDWVNQTLCPNVCSAGACTGSCVPGSKTCTNGRPQTCDATGTPILGTACGTCTACQASTATCIAASGACDDGNACTLNDACSAGACHGTAKACTTPPVATCKDINTLSTPVASGSSCSTGTGACNYLSTTTTCGTNKHCTASSASVAASCSVCNSDASCGSTCAACSGTTPKCADQSTSSKCVSCLVDADCGTNKVCNTSTNTCACSSRFNGNSCQFQVFRGIGVLSGDVNSVANNVSHDGTIVVGKSQTAGSFPHAVRLVNNGTLQQVTVPSGLGALFGCDAVAVDASGTILGNCDNQSPFQTSLANFAAAVDLSGSGVDAPGTAYDVSLDGKVIVGAIGDSGFIKHGSLFTTFSPGGSASRSLAVAANGSLAVGDETGQGSTFEWNWNASDDSFGGVMSLPTWTALGARDVSANGQAIVGFATIGLTSHAIKWVGTTITDLGPGSVFSTNLDGSVLVGVDNNVPKSPGMIWQGTTAHTIASLVASSPDFTSDWTLNGATGISDDGKVVVGNGMHGNHQEGWLVHLP